MSNIKKNNQLFPRIKSQATNHFQESSLTRLSKQLSQYSRYQQKQRQNKSINTSKKQPGYKRLTQPTQMFNDYKEEIKKLKKAVEVKKIKQEFKIQDKLKRIEKLTTKQIHQSMETPRSLNYINLSPPQQIQQPVYSMYQSPPPPLYIPHPYMIPPNLNQSYYEDQYQSHSNRSKRKRYERMRTDLGDDRERNYDQYDEGPTRYQKLKQSNKLKVKRKNPLNKFFLKNNVNKLMKRWRAVVWALYFCYLLPKYSQKIMKVRTEMFRKFERKKFNTQMTMMQKYLVKKCKPFFIYIANQKYTQLIIEEGQTNKMEEQKAIAVKKLINMAIQGLSGIQLNDLNEPATRPAELMHIFCKHGAYPFNIYFTEEQLDLVTISQKNKFIRMDKNLQKSQIINFICNKILLYNTILQPYKVDGQIFSPNNEIINKNFYFLGSIWYQICLQVQDQYLSQVPVTYQLGNWRKLRDRLQINPAKSLSVNGKRHEEQQIISGLLGKKRIDQIFGVNFWRKEKNALKVVIQHLHDIIVQFHKQFKSKIKF